MSLNPQLETAIWLAKRAGRLILDVYESEEFDTTFKSADSPLTRADMASHNLIIKKLKELSAFPVLSEESQAIPYEDRRRWKIYWLVDPLDGSKEFIKRNGEFTVNIALIEDGNPTLGVVHAPALNVTYFALRGEGNYKQKAEGTPVRVRVDRVLGERLRIVVSRSHPGPKLESLLARIKDYEYISVGSSLKFCLVAEGVAHLYPRIGPTMEWDTAAGQCIAEEAGATVTDLRGQRLRYNKTSLLNPEFIVNGASLQWQNWLI